MCIPISTQLLEDSLGYIKTVTHHTKLAQKRRARSYGFLHPNSKSLIKGRVSIRERPKIIESRSRIGDREGDLVEGKKGTGFIVTHVDRTSRFLIGKKIENKQALSFNEATIKVFQKTPSDKLHTLTLDNGKEFSGFKKIEDKLNIDVYFADPYCSWQRGTNEHTNGLLRRYLPKGTSFSDLTDRQLQSIIDTINNRPRKILNYRTPAEVYYG